MFAFVTLQTHAAGTHGCHKHMYWDFSFVWDNASVSFSLTIWLNVKLFKDMEKCMCVLKVYGMSSIPY